MNVNESGALLLVMTVIWFLVEIVEYNLVMVHYCIYVSNFLNIKFKFCGYEWIVIIMVLDLLSILATYVLHKNLSYILCTFYLWKSEGLINTNNL
jgi:hypothetical protein